MRILVIGASGRTGKRIVSSALHNGYQVTALVRSSTSLSTLIQPELTVVQGSPVNETDLERCFGHSTGQPVVVVTALAFSIKPMAPEYFMRDTLSKVIRVMHRFAVARLVVLSAFGVGESARSLAWPLKLVFRYTKMAYGYRDHEAVEEMLKQEQGIKWTLVKPPMLKDEDAVKDIRVFDSVGTGVGMFDSCTMGSVASFVVSHLESETWAEQSVVIAN